MNETLGVKIKQLRKNKKLTLKQISEKTGLSISFLSQLEHGKTSATLESLKKISEALGVNPSYFFSASEDNTYSNVIKNTIATPSVMKTNFFYRDLTGTIENPLFSPILITLNPGDNGGRNFAHKGQECVYVLEGILIVLINDEESILHSFDSIFLGSSFPHYWLNKTKHPIKFLCISATENSHP